MNSVLLQEAQQYFKSHPIMQKIALLYCQKYRSLGHFGGIAVLKNLHTGERQDIAAFLRRDCPMAARISYKEFAAAWEKTRYGDIPLAEFLLSLQPAGFMTRREERESAQNLRKSILVRLQNAYTGKAAVRWLTALQNRDLHLAQKEFYLDEQLLSLTARALSNLPADYERLPLFANRICGNPHAFDQSEQAGRLFIQALAFLQGEKVPTDADERTRLLYDFHIIRDDILNFATIYGLQAYCKDGREISYWSASAHTFSPLNIPLREIAWAEKIAPLTGKDIYIVENSGVFSALVDELQKRQCIVPLLCLHGQLKAASWALLDKLSQSGCNFHYAGDFDPEGIAIAQRLLYRYDSAKLWHMSVDEYNRATLDLPETRLKKIPSPVHPQLQALAAAMQDRRKVLYQESLLQELVCDVAILQK